MKRIISCILVLIFCLTISTCFAEERFALRCGIYFGDTKADVKSKETLKITKETSNELVTESGELAGVSVEFISYRFDNSGKLISVLWNVVDSRNNIYPPILFDTLEEALTKKYGKPDSTDINSSFLIEGAAIEEMLNDDIVLLGMLIGKSGPLQQCEWQIESSGNENVKIDLLYYQAYDEDYRLRLSYDLYTDEELEELQKENNAISDDI